MSAADIVNVLKKIPYPVTVVTVGTGGAENGLTVSWISQVSFDPPMILFSIDKNHYSNLPLSGSGSFVVNLLKTDQKPMAGHCAAQSMQGEDKIDKYPTREAENGGLILSDALGYLDCEVVNTVEAGSHTLVIGKVTDAGILNDDEPLTTASGMRYNK